MIIDDLCPECKGVGTVWESFGEGEVEKAICIRCEGSGVIEVDDEALTDDEIN